MGWWFEGVHLVYGTKVFVEEEEAEEILEREFPDFELVRLSDSTRDTSFWTFLSFRLPKPNKNKKHDRCTWDDPKQVADALMHLPTRDRFQQVMRCLGCSEESIAKAHPKLMMGVEFC